MSTLEEKQLWVKDWMDEEEYEDDLFFENRNLTRSRFNPATHKYELYKDNAVCTETPPPEFNDAILWALEKSKDFGSISKDAEFNETYPGKLRSALDLWRHLKVFFPGITIFDVMAGLWEVRKYTASHFCDTVGRRVFWIYKGEPEEEYDNHHYDTDDEFGLYFEQWKNINEKGKK